MHFSTHSLELLAPAGGVAALHAAVTAGADAVYLGLDKFNARRGADNFTLETLAEACDYAHLRGTKIYVTMNTILLPGEEEEAMEMVRQAWRAGADAFIVQDIGLAREITATLPQARLHISTQMNIHNLAGISAAAALGAARVTLARELSLGEIAEITTAAGELGMEVETFAHGALCVCYSGQCLMSSMLGRRSANRGTCAQACRLTYERHNRALRKDLPSPGEYLLSPKDLCTADLISELYRAGVASLKIEGRMKSPEYVSAVVGVYRQVIDRVLAAAEAAGGDADALDAAALAATQEEHATLEEAFSRGFTTAYLEGARGNAIMSYQRPNNRGVFVGRVIRTDGQSATIRLETDVVPGDVLEVWTKKGRAVLTVPEMEQGSGKTLALSLQPNKKDQRSIAEGDRVFRVRSASAAFEDDPLEPRVPVRGTAAIVVGSPAYVSFATDDAIGQASGPVVEQARTKELAEEDVRSHIDRLGQTPYRIESLDVELGSGAGMGFSVLHHLRADALDDLTEQILAPYKDRMLPRKDRSALGNSASIRHYGGCQVMALATNPACARAAKRAGAYQVYVPALNYKRGCAVVAGQLNDNAEQAGYPKQCAIVLPTIDHEPCGLSRESAIDLDVWSFVKQGHPVLADSLASLCRAVDMGALAEAGPHLPITNKRSLDLAAQLGAERVWLSPELNLAQIKDLVGDGSPVPVGIFIAGAQELMITEHCLLMSQGDCGEQCGTCPRRKSPHYLKDRKGYEFPVITDAFGRSHLYNSVPLDGIPALPELIAAGVTAVMVDTTLMNSEEAEAAVARAVRARNVALADGNALSKLEGHTSGHLYRGVSL